ncbi:MAG: hypothetical protein ACE5KM_16455 [Planctomycetaceae bacterium]
MADKTRSSDRHDDAISARLATVETRVEALHHSVDSLTKSVESLAKRLGSVGRMSWPLLVASIGVLATWTGVVGYLGRMALAPVEVELRHLREDVNTHRADGHPHTVAGRIDALSALTNERFAEVETKIRGVQEIRNREQTHLRELIDVKAKLSIYDSRHGSLER